MGATPEQYPATEAEGPTMKVTIIGPNLPRPLCDKGTLHVHAAGCADITRRYRRQDVAEAWTIEAATILDIVADVYDPQNFDYDLDDPASREAYESDIHFAPCVKLPHEAERDGELACTCDPDQPAGTYRPGCPRHLALQLSRGATALRPRCESHTVTYFHAEVTISTPVLKPAGAPGNESDVDEVWSQQEYLKCEHNHPTPEAAERCARKLARRTIKERQS